MLWLVECKHLCPRTGLRHNTGLHHTVIVKWAQVFPVVFRESVTTHISLLPISYLSSVYVFQLTKQQLHAAGLDSHVSWPLFTPSMMEKMALLLNEGSVSFIFNTMVVHYTGLMDLHLLQVSHWCWWQGFFKKQLAAQEYLDVALQCQAVLRDTSNAGIGRHLITILV